MHPVSSSAAVATLANTMTPAALKQIEVVVNASGSSRGPTEFLNKRDIALILKKPPER